MNSIPKPVAIVVAVVAVVLAIVVAAKSIKSGGANSGYGSKEEIMAMQKAHMQNGGHTMPTPDEMKTRQQMQMQGH